MPKKSHCKILERLKPDGKVFSNIQQKRRQLKAKYCNAKDNSKVFLFFEISAIINSYLVL